MLHIIVNNRYLRLSSTVTFNSTRYYSNCIFMKVGLEKGDNWPDLGLNDMWTQLTQGLSHLSSQIDSSDEESRSQLR